MCKVKMEKNLRSLRHNNDQKNANERQVVFHFMLWLGLLSSGLTEELTKNGFSCCLLAVQAESSTGGFLSGRSGRINGSSYTSPVT